MVNKMKNNILISFLKYWLPVLIWASVIFLFSSHPTRKATEIYWQDFILKKLAHVIEYAIFTILLYRALINAGIRRRDGALAALVLAILYGMSDEFHQSFIPGREPTIRDVFFDSLGSSLAIYWLIRILPKSGRKIREISQKLEILK